MLILTQYVNIFLLKIKNILKKKIINYFFSFKKKFTKKNI